MIAVPEKRAAAGEKKVRKKRAGTGRIPLSPKERSLAAKIRPVVREIGRLWVSYVVDPREALAGARTMRKQIRRIEGGSVTVKKESMSENAG